MGIPYIDEDRENIYCCGTPVVVTEDEDGFVVVSYEGGEPIVSSMYSLYIWGGDNTFEKGAMDFKETSITINAGMFAGVSGGNRGPGTIDHAKVVMNDGYLDSGIDAGIGYNASIIPGWTSADQGECHIKKSDIVINGGYTYLVYGGTGSGIATVDEAVLTVTGGEIDWLTCGSSNGVCKKAIGKISGNAKINNALAGGNRGTVGYIDMAVTGGDFELVSVMGDATGTLEDGAIVRLYGGNVGKFSVYEDQDITPETKMDNIQILYYPGVINEEDIKNAPEGIKKDITKGEAAPTKRIRIYPFPHQTNNIFGVLIEGKAIDRPAELPMTEQEIRMCLGMGQMFELVGDKFILIDIHNYNQDNSDADEYIGEFPCDDCELMYPRDEKQSEDDSIAVQSMDIKKVKKVAKKSTYKPAPEKTAGKKKGNKVNNK